MDFINEIVLRDETGLVKETLISEALENLRIKELDKELTPGYFQRILRRDPENKLGYARITELLSLNDDKLETIFPDNKKPSLKAKYEFANLISSNPDLCYKIYLRRLPVPLLSDYNFSVSLIHVLNNVLLECLRYIDFKIISEKQKFKLIRVQKYFEGKALPEIASEFGETPENSRQIIKSNIFTEIVNKKSTFYLNPSFHEKISTFKSDYLFNDLFTTEIESYSDDLTIEQIKNRLDVIGLNFVDLTINDTTHYFVVETWKNAKYRVYINSFVQFMKKTFHERTIDELHLEFSEYYKREKGWNESLSEDLGLFRSLLRSSFVDSRYSEELEKEVFVIDWFRLFSIELRVAKLLLDSGEVMSQEEIFTEYNTRCEYYGIAPLENISKLHIKTNDFIKNVRNGYWVYSTEGNYEKDDARELIGEFIKEQGGIAGFNEIKEFLRLKNLVYPDTSLRIYISATAKRTFADRELFVHHEYTDQLNIKLAEERNSLLGKKLLPLIKDVILGLKQDIKKRHLVALIKDSCLKEELEIKQVNSIGYYLDKFVDEDVLQIQDDLILIESIDKENISRIQYRKEPDYREFIRNEAIVLLKESPNFTLKSIELWNQLKHHLPKGLASNNFYKIFTDSGFFFCKKNDTNGKRIYSLNLASMPELKPIGEAVANPSEELIVTSELPETSRKNYDYADNSWDVDRIFSFIDDEFSRKYKDSDWDFEYGLKVFRESLYENVEDSKLTYWGDLLLKSLGRVLINYSDYFDRDTCLQRLSLSFEAYLKQLGVRDTSGAGKPGLGSLLYGHSHLKRLKEYKDLQFFSPTANDKVVLSFSRKLSSLVYYRNLYAHDPSHKNLEMAFDDHIRYIMDAISLYIYIPNVLKAA